MTAQAITPETLPAIMWQNQPVITTELLAEIYGTAMDNINKNFERNKSRFIEGLHYILLQGADLKTFRLHPTNSRLQISNMVRKLYLWTERGTVRHAKILDTDNAWAVQERLENFYFANKPAKSDPINEPLKIPFATKEQREPLVKAVRRLVSVASEKGKSISYENAHSIINLKMGVSSVEELTLEQIPQAMALVGDILERVVLEGEFIAKGEPEPQAKVEPEIPSDPFTNREREQLKKIVGSLSEKFHFDKVWTSAIHYRLRKATGCKSPNYFRISDKPVMAKEFGQIFTIISRVQSVIRKVELESAKRLMRNDEEFETVIAELETDCKTLLSELEGEVKTLLDTCDRYEIERFAA